MTVGLLRDLVMVLPLFESLSDSGIVAIGLDKGSPLKGVVIAVGPGKTVNGVLKPTAVQPGDKIIYVQNNMREVKVQGDTLHVIPETEVLCKLQ